MSFSFLSFLKISYVFFFNKVGEQEGGTGSARNWEVGVGGGGGVQTVYTHVSKCKNNKNGIFRKY
jgi:hypothetical protein